MRRSLWRSLRRSSPSGKSRGGTKLNVYEGLALIEQAELQDFAPPPLSPRFDPVTSAILVDVAIGIAQGLAVAALKSLFGGKPIDVRALLVDLLTNIGTLVRASIAENEVVLASARIDAVVTLLQQYNNSPETSRFRLEQAVIASNEALSTLSRFMPLSAEAYLMGSMISIATLQEFAKLTGAPGDRLSVQQFAQRCVPVMEQGIVALVAQNDKRVSAIQVREGFDGAGHFAPSGGGGHDHGVIWATASFTVDDVKTEIRRVGPNSKAQALSEATAIREQALASVRAAFAQYLQAGFNQALDKVRSIAVLAS